MAGPRRRFSLAVASMALFGAAVVAWFHGGWDLVCPVTRSVGFMDCGGQPDAVWRSNLPGWITMDVLFWTGLVGAAGVLLAVVLELRSRQRPEPAVPCVDEDPLAGL